MARERERDTTVEMCFLTSWLSSSLNICESQSAVTIIVTHMGIRSGSPLKSGRTLTWSMCHGSVVDGTTVVTVLVVRVDAREREDADAGLDIAGVSVDCAGRVPKRCMSRVFC